MNKEIYIPKSIRESIKPIKRGFPKKIKVIVFDCETNSASTGRAYLCTCFNGIKIRYIWNLNDNENISIPIELINSKVKPVNIKVNKIFERFIEYIFEEFGKTVDSTNIVMAHNLEFDISAVMDSIYPVIFGEGRKITPSFTYQLDSGDTFKIKIYGNKMYWASIWLIKKGQKKRRKVIVIDTMNFVQGSLYKLSRELNLAHAKNARPDLIENGKKPLNKREKDIVTRYVNPEIRATYDLAKWILDRQKEFDVPVSVSIADLASKIFRKNYISDVIAQCPNNVKKLYVYSNDEGVEFKSESSQLNAKKVMTKEKRYFKNVNQTRMEDCHRYELIKGVMRLAEESYHGGRASSFVGKLCEIINVNCYDYNSFYPYAMTQLPPLTKGKWMEINCFDDEHEGFYEVSGTVKKCKYPIILPHSQTFAYAGINKDEKIVNASLVSYEIREALRLKELEIEKIRGYVWIPDKDASNPFRDYVEYFYKMKKDETLESSKRWFYKILLNSLYGKCIQANPFPEYLNQCDYKLIDKETNKVIALKKRFKAGPMYLPHIASWITSYCRAQLHSDLHKYNGLTCSTDSIMSKEHIDEGNELGQLKLENVNNVKCDNGLLLFIRPKFYIYFSSEVKDEVEKLGSLRGYLKTIDLDEETSVLKYALHGFRGKIVDVLRMYRDKDSTYTFKHFWKTKESIIQRVPEKIRVVENKKQKINIDWESERMLCGLTPIQASKSKEMCIYPNCFSCVYGAKET